MRMAWDQVGDRQYEGGVDRGVLYLSDGSGVPWNGLTAVDVVDGSEVESIYFDGIKIMDVRSPGDFSGSLKAFTYPDEFLEFEGYLATDYGVLLSNQMVENTFGLSYRTLVGNDTSGDSFGYKIHLIWNLTAIPDTKSYNTFSEQQNPTDLSWSLTAVPENAPGFRPTAHVVIDTRLVNPYLVADLEDILYGVNPEDLVEDPEIDGGSVEAPVEEFIDGGSFVGSGLGVLDGGSANDPGEGVADGSSQQALESDVLDGGSVTSSGYDSVDGGSVRQIVGAGVQAKLPALSDLLLMLKDWAYITIVDNGDGSWTATDIDELGLITMVSDTEFRIDRIQATYLDDDTYTIETTHSFLGG